MLRVRPDLHLDEEELEFRATTSTGPGGQHVNRSQTRVIVRYDVASSPSLSEEQRARLMERLAPRLSGRGVIQVSSQKHRSQARNRDAAIERLVELLAEALQEDAPRKASRPTRASKLRRKDEKKKRSDKKRLRSKPTRED